MENRTGIDYGPYIEGEPEVTPPEEQDGEGRLEVGGLTPLKDLTPAELTQRQKEITQVLQETSIQVPGYAEQITFSQEDIDTIITFKCILWYRPETLREIIPPRFIANVANLGVSPKEWMKAALKQPSLFYQSPETINRNITESADLLGIEDKRDYIKAALRAPSLFYQSPETVNTNIEEATTRLGFTKAQYLDIALRQPPLFYCSPVTVSENFKVVKILAGNSDDIAREMVADLPNLLTYAEERNLLHYIARQITDGETNLIKNPQEIIIEYTKQHPPKASSHSLLDPDKHPEMVALLAWLRHNPRVQTKKLEELLSAFIEAGKKRRRKRTKRLKEDYETEKTARGEVEKPAREEADNF